MGYEVVIVGAGPAGIFAALTLADHGIGPVLLLEQGKDLDKRSHEDVQDRAALWLRGELIYGGYSSLPDVERRNASAQ